MIERTCSCPPPLTHHRGSPMKTKDTGYSYNPLILRYDLSPDKGVFLPKEKLRTAKPKLVEVVKARKNRLPLFKDVESQRYLGGFYELLASDEEVVTFYSVVKTEAQICGYLDSLDNRFGRSHNPFPSDLSDGLPRNVWAYAYHKGIESYKALILE